MVSCGYEVLDRAIAGRMPVVLTAQPDERREWPVRLLAYDAGQEGIWVQPLDESHQDFDAFISSGSAIQAAIGIDHSRYAFLTRIDRREMHYWLTETMMVEAVLLGGPIELFVAERRAHPRFLFPDASNILAQLTSRFSVSPLKVKPWDVSAGGISFLCPRDAASLPLKRDHPISFWLNYRGRAIVAKGTVRFTRSLTERIIKLGVEFIPDSLDDDARTNLQFLLIDMNRLARPRKTR
jgi:hypothetical protein